MNQESKSGGSIRDILAGGAVGAVFGGVVTFGLAFILSGGIVLPVVMAMHGAFTGGMGLAWAVAMQVGLSEDEHDGAAADVLPTLLPTSGKQVSGLQRVA